MRKSDMLACQISTFTECRDLLIAKNADYAGEREDALANFKMCDTLGITGPAQGVLVRLSDKMMRIINLLKSGKAAVPTEKVEDTINDAINYLVILKAILQEAGENTVRTVDNNRDTLEAAAHPALPGEPTA